MRVMLKNQMDLFNELTNLLNQAQPVTLDSCDNKWELNSNNCTPRINIIE